MNVNILVYNPLRVIPQGTFDNNLGPDRLAGHKALDPNYCRQPTLSLHNLCLEILTAHGNELRLSKASIEHITFPKPWIQDLI